MGRWVRGLSPGTEFAVVIVGAFGYFILGQLLVESQPAAAVKMTSAQLHVLAVHELIVFAALAAFLAARGWSLKRIGLRPSPMETVIGLGLAVAIYVTWLIVWSVIASLWPQADAAAQIGPSTAPGLGLATVAAVSIINATFEEVFVCGYVVTALKERTGAWTAINISIGIRLLYHLYQGPTGWVFIILFGVALAYFYAYRGRLWPPIVVHGLFDFGGLYDLVGAQT